MLEPEPEPEPESKPESKPESNDNTLNIKKLVYNYIIKKGIKGIEVYVTLNSLLCNILPKKCKYFLPFYYTIVFGFNGDSFRIIDIINDDKKSIYNYYVTGKIINELLNINTKKEFINHLNHYLFPESPLLMVGEQGGVIMAEYKKSYIYELETNIFMIEINNRALGNDMEFTIILDFNDIVDKYEKTKKLDKILLPVVTITNCLIKDSMLSNRCISNKKSECKCVTN